MLKTFTYNGISSADFGIIIGTDPKPNRPARKFSVANVAGRNGNLYDIQDAWGEVTQEYYILAGIQMKETASELFYRIFDWLNSADGYVELTDDYDPEHYRLAICVDATEVVTGLEKFGKATIRFRCRPERFLTDYKSVKVSTNPLNQVTALYSEVDSKPILSATMPSCSASSIVGLLNQHEYAKFISTVSFPSTVTTKAETPLYYISDTSQVAHTVPANTLLAVRGGNDDYYYVTYSDMPYFVAISAVTASGTQKWYEIQRYSDNLHGYVSEQSVATASVVEFNNPTNHIAKPEIIMSGLGAFYLAINDVKCTISSSSGFLKFDCEQENVSVIGSDAYYYGGKWTDINQRVTVTDIGDVATAEFLKLKAGMNIIRCSKSTTLTINTRFWEI